MTYKILKLTKGCFNNNYLLIKDALDIFPKDSLGGGNTDSKGTNIDLYVGMKCFIQTDVDLEHGIFRDRKWFIKFAQRHELDVDDEVVLEKVGERAFYLYPKR